ncbi:MAG: hypothetical protein R8K47_08335 [Mariprofundaceae bacterium]
MKGGSARLAVLLAALTLAGCGGGKAAHVENPYVQRGHDFFADGLEAMRRERWVAAERAFSRALLAAQLADDPAMVRRAWYDLGMARRAAGHRQEAAEALARAAVLARRQGDATMAMRARLALALLPGSGAGEGRASLLTDIERGSWPPDIELMAARWLQRGGVMDRARQHYLNARRRAGKDATGLRMKAQSSLGLALLAREAGDGREALRETARALEWCRQVGAPRVTAHALLLRGELSERRQDRIDALERALAIYDALGDRRGQARAVRALLAEAEQAGDAIQAARLRLRLSALEEAGDRDAGRR